MEKIKPSEVLYIKLGPGGVWEKDCIKQSQTIRLGYLEINHEDCLAGRWDDVRKFWSSGQKHVTTSHVNQIKRFYESDESVLWITFYGGRMWWCFSRSDIKQLPDKSKTRSVIGEWKSTDIRGGDLLADNLGGKLVKTEAYQGTICRVNAADYAVQRINAIIPPYIKDARDAVTHLETKLGILVTKLHWKDFELLVDLIFRHAGWQRVRPVGETAKTLDLDLISPVTGERCMVQIKSKSDQEEFKKYCEEFKNYKDYDRFFYVVHSPKNMENTHDSRVTLWLLTDITKHVINSGLAGWLISRSS